MFVNYFKTAWQNILRQKHYSLLNIACLVLGMTSCIMILLYVFEELNYDSWLQDRDRILRYELEYLDAQGNMQVMRKAALRARGDLLESFPGIDQAVRIIDHRGVLSHADGEFFETIWFVDPEFPEIFPLSMLAGNADASLADKTTILLSRTMASKYFGSVDDALGRTLSLDGHRDYRVAGVFDDIPDRSHVTFEAIVPYDQADSDFHFGYSESWGAVEGYTYLKLADGVDPAAISARLPQFLESRMPGFTVPVGMPFSEMLNPYLLGVSEIHLDAGGIGNIKPPGNRQLLFSLSLIAALVLFAACINFVNLSTMRSMGRAREISIRKVAGADKGQITLQFLLESVMLSLIALCISMTLVELLLPLYNNALGLKVSAHYLDNIVVLTELVFLGALIGCLSGLFPALRIASLKPALVLRGGRAALRGAGLGWLQPVLVIGQFVISAALIIATLVIFLQQLFIENKDLGFSPENKLVIRNLDEGLADSSKAVLASTLEQIAGVTGSAFSVATPADLTGVGFYRGVTVPGYQDESLPLYPKAIAPDFFATYEIALASGRHFSANRASDAFYWTYAAGEGSGDPDRAAAILNQTAVSEIGFENPEAALGNTIVLGNAQLEIIGVVQDFHFQSLQEKITPNIYLYSPDEYLSLTISFAANANVSELVEEIERVWSQFVPEFPLVFEFVEENVKQQYAEQQLQFLLIMVFASLCIVIACLGLYAMAAFITRQRTKEIGVRKVYGARMTDIVGIFLYQFSKPVLIANVLSWPLAWIAMNRWLESFAYRIELSPMIFVVGGLIALFIALLTVVSNTVRVATINPVRALRYE